MARFWADMNEFFEAGVTELDDGKKKEKKKAEKPEAEAMKCPSCGHLHNPRPFCPACGHEYPKKAAIEHVPGTLKELVAHGDAGLLRTRLWPQVCGFVQALRLDPERSQKRAQAIYHDLTGGFARAKFETTNSVPPSREVRNKIKANQIAWRSKAGARQGVAA